MRLAICLYKYFPYGGLAQDMLAVAKHAYASGHSVDIYTHSWQGEKPEGIAIHYIPKKGKTNHSACWNFAKSLNVLLSQKSYDVVVGFNKIPGIDVYYAGDPCYKAKMSQASILRRMTARHRMQAKLEKLVLGESSDCKILIINDGQKKDFQQYYQTKEERFIKLPPYVEKEKFSASEQTHHNKQFHHELGIGTDKKLIVTIGSGFKAKGVDRALRAVAALPTMLKGTLHYWVIGENNAKPYIKLAKELGISSLVTFSKGRTDIPDILCEAHLLLHPAYSEAGGKILLEALVSNLPVITTSVCGYAPYVEEAKAGVVLKEPFSQQALNQTLKTLLHHDKNSTKEIRNFPEKAMEFFTMPAVALEAIVQQSREKPMTWARNIPHQWLKKHNVNTMMKLNGHMYRDVENRKTFRFEHLQRAYFAKLHFGVGVKEILKNISKGRVPIVSAENEYRAINRLKQLNVNTLHWIAYGKRGLNPAKKKSFIITDELSNTINLEEFSALWKEYPPEFSLKLAIIKELARIARTLHSNGLNHRDFYACHFLLDKAQVLNKPFISPIKIYLIDLHRVSIKKRVGKRWVIKDLSGLYFSLMNNTSKKDYLRFMQYYREDTLKNILNKESAFWERVSQKAVQLYKKCSVEITVP